MARRPIRTICRRAVGAADVQGVWVRLPTQTQLHLDCPSPTSRSYGKPLFPSLSGVVSPSPEDRRFGAIPSSHLSGIGKTEKAATTGEVACVVVRLIPEAPISSGHSLKEC